MNDVEETISFYEKCFGFSRKFITHEKDYGELITGETVLAFASFELGNANFKKGFTKITNSKPPLGMEIVLVSDNIDEDFQKAISAGATEYESISEKSWGQKVGYLIDKNGILIEMCTPIDN